MLRTNVPNFNAGRPRVGPAAEEWHPPAQTHGGTRLPQFGARHFLLRLHLQFHFRRGIIIHGIGTPRDFPTVYKYVMFGREIIHELTTNYFQ